jgi:hypothetical protein
MARAWMAAGASGTARRRKGGDRNGQQGPARKCSAACRMTIMSELVGRAIQPADPLSSGSSRLERRLQARLPAPLGFAICFRISDADH